MRVLLKLLTLAVFGFIFTEEISGNEDTFTTDKTTGEETDEIQTTTPEETTTAHATTTPIPKTTDTFTTDKTREEETTFSFETTESEDDTDEIQTTTPEETTTAHATTTPKPKTTADGHSDPFHELVRLSSSEHNGSLSVEALENILNTLGERIESMKECFSLEKLGNLIADQNTISEDGFANVSKALLNFVMKNSCTDIETHAAVTNETDLKELVQRLREVGYEGKEDSPTCFNAFTLRDQWNDPSQFYTKIILYLYEGYCILPDKDHFVTEYKESLKNENGKVTIETIERLLSQLGITKEDEHDHDSADGHHDHGEDGHDDHDGEGHGDDEHDHDDHGEEEHGDEERDHADHGEDEHGHDEHDHDDHGEEEHGDDEHDHDDHGEEEHGDDEHDHDDHGEEEHGDDEHDHDDHGAEDHGDDEHDHDDHGEEDHGDDEHDHDDHGEEDHDDEEHDHDDHDGEEHDDHDEEHSAGRTNRDVSNDENIAGPEDDHDHEGHGDEDADHDDHGEEEHNHEDHEGEEHDHNGRCFSAEELLNIFEIDGEITEEQAVEMCPAFVQQLVSGACKADDHSDHTTSTRNSDYTMAKVYGYGTASVAIISLLALIGFVLFPALLTGTYKMTMQFFIGLGIGTMAADALVHIIPHALGVHDHDTHDSHGHEDETHEEDMTFVWKMSIVFGGVYVLFFFENFLRLMKKRRDTKSNTKRADVYANKSIAEPDPDKVVTSFSTVEGDATSSMASEEVLDSNDTVCSHFTTTLITVFIGDVLHNFADGVAIGVSFTNSWTVGIGTSIAILCHELPHELADFAIYLKNGASKFQAIGFNFAAACCAFAGLYAGIAMSHDEVVRNWLMSAVAGMFLYIALVQVMNEMVREETPRPVLQFVVQNLGLLLGWAIMLVIALYEDRLQSIVKT